MNRRHIVKIFIPAISLFLVLAGLLSAAHPSSAAETNAPPQTLTQLPAELQDALKNADNFTLYSIKPEPDFQHTSTNTFEDHVILGQVDVKSKDTRTKLIAALKDGIDEQNKRVPPGVIWLPDCFNPRHGIRATKGNETVELLICFECEQIQGSSNQGKSWSFITTRTPAPIFNGVLKKAHVPLAED